MRDRGKVYWDWVDASLHCRSIDERLPNGALINVQARLSLLGRTSLFIGVYGANGKMIFEEATDSSPSETITSALARGLERARIKAPITAQSIATSKPEKLPRAGSKQNPGLK